MGMGDLSSMTKGSSLDWKECRSYPARNSRLDTDSFMPGRMILVSAYALMIAHPGPIFGWPETNKPDNVESKAEASDMMNGSEPI